jgi:hypothetical protein
MWYPVALLKVPGIQRAAPTTPAITTTAQKSGSTTIRKLVINTGRRAAVQVTVGVISLKSATLKHTGIHTCPLQLSCNRQTGNTAADDAHCDDECFAITDLACVDEHAIPFAM